MSACMVPVSVQFAVFCSGRYNCLLSTNVWEKVNSTVMYSGNRPGKVEYTQISISQAKRRISGFYL